MVGPQRSPTTCRTQLGAWVVLAPPRSGALRLELCAYRPIATHSIARTRPPPTWADDRVDGVAVLRVAPTRRSTKTND